VRNLLGKKADVHTVRRDRERRNKDYNRDKITQYLETRAWGKLRMSVPERECSKPDLGQSLVNFIKVPMAAERGHARARLMF